MAPASSVANSSEPGWRLTTTGSIRSANNSFPFARPIYLGWGHLAVLRAGPAAVTAACNAATVCGRPLTDRGPSPPCRLLRHGGPELDTGARLHARSPHGGWERWGASG